MSLLHLLWLSSGPVSRHICLTYHIPTPCDCIVPVQWRLLLSDTIIVLVTYLLTNNGSRNSKSGSTASTSVAVIKREQERQTDRQTDGQTSRKACKDLDLEVHLPALPAAAVTARQTKQMIILLPTDQTCATAGRRPQTLNTQTVAPKQMSHDR